MSTRLAPAPTRPSPHDVGWCGPPTTSSARTATSEPPSPQVARTPASRCRPSTTRSGPRPALLEESLGAAIVGFDRWHEPPADPYIDELLPWHHWWTEFDAAPTSGEAFDIFFTHGVGILERVAPLVAALHGAAGDPEAAEVIRIAEQRRVAAYREAVRVIAGKGGGLRDGLTVEAGDRRAGRALQRRAVPIDPSRSRLVRGTYEDAPPRPVVCAAARTLSPAAGTAATPRCTSGEEPSDSFGEALAGPPGHHEETATGLSAFDPPAVVTATFDGYSATVHGSSSGSRCFQWVA